MNPLVITIVLVALAAVLVAPVAVQAARSLTHGLAANAAEAPVKSFADLVREKREAGLTSEQAESAALAQVEHEKKEGLRKDLSSDEILEGMKVGRVATAPDTSAAAQAATAQAAKEGAFVDPTHVEPDPPKPAESPAVAVTVATDAADPAAPAKAAPAKAAATKDAKGGKGGK